jgi:hypothetical protein
VTNPIDLKTYKYIAPEECHRQVIKNEESGTELLDDDAHMDDAANTSTPASATFSASATLPLSSHSPAPPVSDATIPTGDLTTALIQQQSQETYSLMPSSAQCIAQQSHAPFVDLAVQQPPLGDVSITADLEPRLDGLYTFPVNDVNMFPSNGQSGHSHQLQLPSTNGTSLLTDSWSDASVLSLPQPVDDTLDVFSLSLPFQPAPPAIPTLIPLTLHELGTFTTITAQAAAVGTTSVALPSAMPSLMDPPLVFSSLETPSLEIPSSETPSLVTPSLVAPSSETPSWVIPSSVATSSVSASSVAPSSETPCLVGKSPVDSSPHFPPNHQHLVNILTTERPSNGATTTSAVSPLVTTNSAKTSLTNPTAMSAQSLPDHHGKENTKAVATEVGNTKKRKDGVKSVKPKRKRAKEDNSMTVDMRAAQEKDTPGESGAAETAATRSGRKSKIPSHLKEGGYAPPRRITRKTID